MADDWNFTKWLGGHFSALGKGAVWGNNNIIPDESFRRRQFKDGYAKRFGLWNTVIINPQEVEIPEARKHGKGIIYLHGSVNGPFFEGRMFYDTYTERFSIEFEEISYPVYSDAINLRRMSTTRENVGLVQGSIPYIRVKDFNTAPIENGTVYIKRFEYQSITKSSLDTTSPYRRNTKYYSMVFNELYEKGRPLEFEKKLCCSRCGQYYYTGALMPADQSASIAFQKDKDAPGYFYTVDDREPMRVANPQHKQYYDAEEIENLKNYKPIRAVKWDITKYDYDYRILYYPKWNFAQSEITGYMGATGWVECDCTYGIKPYTTPGTDGSYITVQDYAEQNEFSYMSHIAWMNKIAQACKANVAWRFKQEMTTQVARTTRDKDDYAYEALAWHNSQGRVYMQGGFPMVEYNTKAKLKKQWGAYYTHEGDEHVIGCTFWPTLISFYGGDTHGGAERGSSEDKTIGHHWLGYSSITLEYAALPYYDIWDDSYGNFPPGEFLSDPDNSQSLSDEDLANEGITPKNDETKVEEKKEKLYANYYQSTVDPFEITYAANFSSNDIDLQCYVPHVFTNVQRYQEIGKLEKRLITATDALAVYSTKKLIQKDGGDGNKYSFLSDVYGQAPDISNSLYWFEQKTREGSVWYVKQTYPPDEYFDQHPEDIGKVFYWHTEGTVNFNDGVEKVYYTSTHHLTGKYINLDDLFHTPYWRYGYGSGGWEPYGHTGYSFREVQQRVVTAYSKYSFLCVGTPGLYDSVFNRYIFIDFLEDKSTITEEEIPAVKHGEHQTDEFDDNYSSSLFGEMTEKEWKYLQYWYGGDYYREKLKIEIGRPSYKWSCYTADLNPADTKGCFTKNETISFTTRQVTYQYPWISLGTETDENGYTYETFALDLDEYSGANTWENGNPYPAIHPDYRDSDAGGSNIDPTPKKKKTPAEVSPVWENVNIPSYYLDYWSTPWNQFALAYSEHVIYMTVKKGALMRMGNPSSAWLHPWSGSILTGIGCCPIRLKDKYLVFDGKKTATKNAWDPMINQPYMINRFHSTGSMFVNYLAEGIYPHPDGDKFIIIVPWFTDADEGFSGIQLRVNGLTDFAGGKCSTGFNISCDSALAVTYSIADPTKGMPRVSSANIYSEDKTDSHWKVNKGIFPVLKGYWQPDGSSKIASNMSGALFMIETQCMIEGPEYYFSKSESDYPPGFAPDFKGYQSRGLMVAINHGEKFTNYVIGGKDCGFFDYFKPQNEKRDKINLRRAHDTKPKAMRKEEGYYWDCEEAFGPYEIASPFTFETQIAAKMSFSVRVGEEYGVLFLLAYDIDKWPCTAADMPSDDEGFPEIYPEEEYKFKSAYFTLKFNGANKPTWSDKFKDWQMTYIFTKVKLDRAKYSSRQLDNMGKKYLEIGKKKYKGIVVPKSYTGKNAYGVNMLPIYNIDESYSVNENNKVKRGIVRLVRWRTFKWNVAQRNSDGTVKTKNGETLYDEYTGAIAQLAVMFNQTEQPNMYYTGGDKVVLMCFYQKGKSTKIEVKNLNIPDYMVWQEDKTTQEMLDKGEYDYEEHLLQLTRVGIFDTVTIESRAMTSKETKKKDYSDVFMLEALTIPVIATDGNTYLCVTTDCENWEIAGVVDRGYALTHLAAGYLPPEDEK